MHVVDQVLGNAELASTRFMWDMSTSGDSNNIDLLGTFMRVLKDATSQMEGALTLYDTSGELLAVSNLEKASSAHIYPSSFPQSPHIAPGS
jgi:hypothetical protein